MYRLYLALKERQDNKQGSATDDEVRIARSKIPMDSAIATTVLKSLEEKTSNTIPQLFAQQETAGLVHY